MRPPPSPPPMTVTFTCPQCTSGIEVPANPQTTLAPCQVCGHQLPLAFNSQHEKGVVDHCPHCEGKDFYQQKDFNRKIGVILFIIAAVIGWWTYGLSLVALYLVDLWLFKKLPDIVICYSCQAIFRGANNVGDVKIFDHQRHERILYGQS